MTITAYKNTLAFINKKLTNTKFFLSFDTKKGKEEHHFKNAEA